MVFVLTRCHSHRRHYSVTRPCRLRQKDSPQTRSGEDEKRDKLSQGEEGNAREGVGVEASTVPGVFYLEAREAQEAGRVSPPSWLSS